jgi:hypothetical protein
MTEIILKMRFISHSSAIEVHRNAWFRGPVYEAHESSSKKRTLRSETCLHGQREKEPLTICYGQIRGVKAFDGDRKEEAQLASKLSSVCPSGHGKLE